MTCPFESKMYGCGCSAMGHYGGGKTVRVLAKPRSIAGTRSTYLEARTKIRNSFGGTKKTTVRKTHATKNPRVSPKKEYFLRPNQISAETKKYCRCLAEVGAKQSSSCLRGSTAIGKGCYNPYAICGRIRPAGMKGGCAMLYDYKNMPYALKESTAAMHNKTIKELVDSARREAEYMKHA